jgi:hypothetical protein
MPTETNVVERLMSDAPEKPLIGPAFRRMQFAETYIRSGAQLKIAADAHGYDHGTGIWSATPRSALTSARAFRKSQSKSTFQRAHGPRISRRLRIWTLPISTTKTAL